VQGSQSVNANSLLAFIATETSSNSSESVNASALLSFVSSITSGQGNQTVDAIGTSGNGSTTGTVTSEQGSQTVDAQGNNVGGDVVSASLDGAGVGVGNKKSWMKNVEYVADHRIRHQAQIKTAQGEQQSSVLGLVINPTTNVVMISKQAPQRTHSVGFVINPSFTGVVNSGQNIQATRAIGHMIDTDLELYAVIAAAMLYKQEMEAA